MKQKIFSVILGMCFLMINMTGCLPVEEESIKSEEETLEDGNEVSVKKAGSICKMEYHSYPNENTMMEILSEYAGFKDAKWEITDKSEKRTGFQYKDNVMVFNYEEDFIARIYFESDHYYEMIEEDDNNWETKKMDEEKGKEMQKQAESMLKDFGIEDCFVGKWKKIDYETYLMKFYQRIEPYTVSDILVEASDKEFLGMPSNMEVVWNEDGLKYCNISYYMDVKEMQQVELPYNYSKAEKKIKFYWEQKNGVDEEWTWNYEVGEGTCMYVAYPDVVDLDENEYKIETEYRPMWVFEVTKYSTGVGKNEAEGTHKSIKNCCVDAQTGEVFEG